MTRILNLIVLLSFFTIPCYAAILLNVPVDIVQPDGSKAQAFTSGDEFYHPVEDANGFTILQDSKTGFYVYAEPDGNGIKASGCIVGKDNPTSFGLVPHLRQDPNIVKEKAESHRRSMEAGGERTHNIGTLNSIVVFLRFSDQTEFPAAISYNQYRDSFDDIAPGALSLKSYFLEASNSNLTIDSYLYPLAFNTNVYSYQDSHTRSYFDPYNVITNPIGYQNSDQRTEREHSLLYSCVTWLNSIYQVPVNLNIDNDSDGLVDNVTFIVRGATSGWSDLLWPHRWSLGSYNAILNNKRVYDYTFLMEGLMSVGVSSHEMSHVLGYPDLYHYNNNTIDLTGLWDIMSSASDIPQYHLTYTDYKYGHWCLEPPLISTPGVYTLAPRTASRFAAYKIASTVPGQFYIVEYRKKTGLFESSISGTGLLVYRINTACNGNANGPPDEIYLYRPNGTSNANGNPEDAHYSAETGRTSIHQYTAPKPFLADGTTNGGLIITDISEAGDQISFRLRSTIPKIWVGSTSSNWHTASNWANGIPTSADDVEIPSGTTYKPSITTSNAVCNNLKIAANTSVSITTYSLTLSGDLHNYGMLYQYSSSYLNIAGSMYWESGSSVGATGSTTGILLQGNLYIKSGSNVAFTNGILDFRGSANSDIYLYAPAQLAKLSFNKTAGTVTLNAASTSDLTIKSSLDVGSNNTFAVNSAQIIHVEGSIFCATSGHVYFNAGSLHLDGSATLSISMGADSYLNNLKINKESMYTYITLNTGLKIKGNLDNYSGDLRAGAYQIEIGGDWTHYLGSLTAGTGTVVFNGTGNQSCDTETFNILELNKSSGSFLVNSGKLVIANKYRWIAGNLNAQNGTFTALDLEQNGIYGSFAVSTGGYINLNQDAAQRCDLNGFLNNQGGTITIKGSGDYAWAYAANAGITMSDGYINWKNNGISIPLTAYTLNLNITGGDMYTPGNFTNTRPNVHFDQGALFLLGSSYTSISLATGSYLYDVYILKTVSRSRDGVLRTIGAYASSNLLLHGTLSFGIGIFDPMSYTVTAYGDILAGGTVQITNSGTMTSGDDFVWESGSTSNITNGTINCYGNWKFNYGSIAALDNAQVNLKADYGGTILCSSSDSHFGNLAIQGTQENPYFHILPASTDSLLVFGTLTIDPNNELDCSGKYVRIANQVNIPSTALLSLGTNGFVNIQSNLVLSGELNVGTGTCKVYGGFYPSINSLLQIDGGSFIQNAPLNAEESTTELLGAIQMTAGLLEITNRNVIFGAHELRTYGEGIVRIGGNFSATTSNAFKMDTGELQLTSRIATSLTCNNGNYINNLQINKYRGITVSLLSAIVVKGQLYINSGKLVANNYNITLGGNWYNPISTTRFDPGSGTVIFNQIGGIQTISGSTTFYNVTDSHTGNELQFLNASTVSNTLLVSNLVVFQNALTVNILNNNSSTGTVEQHQGYTSTIASYDGGGTLKANPGILIINDLVDLGIFGNYYATGGTIELHQDAANWCDLNGNLYVASSGVINIYGGSMIADFAYSANASITMDSGEINFKSWGCRLNNTSYTFAATITGGVIRSAGDFNCARTNFNPSAGTIELNGTTDASISMATGSSFYSLTINKGARAEVSLIPIASYPDKDGRLHPVTRSNTVSLVNSITVRKDLQINSGVFNPANYGISLYGNWSNTVGTAGFTEGTGTVTFIGNLLDTGLLTSETFYNFVLNNTATASDAFELTAGQTLTVSNILTLTDGTLEMNNNSTLTVGGNLSIASGAGLNANIDTGLNINLGGNWTDSNTTYNDNQGFSPGTSTLTFNGTTDQTITLSGTAFEVYNLTLNKLTGKLQQSKSCKVINTCNLTRGEWLDLTNNLVHQFAGNVIMNANSIWNGTTSNTVKCIGAAAQDFTYACTSGYIYNFTVEKTANTTLRLMNPVIALNTGTLLITSGVLNLNHKYYRATGHVTINNTGKLTIDSDAWLEVGSGFNLTVNSGGILEVIGTAGHLAKVTHQSGNYGFNVESGGTLSAEYALFEYMNINGIYLKNGSLVDAIHSISNCTFQNGAATGTLLKVDNSATLTIANAIFPTNTWSGSKNITKSLNQGLVEMSGATGGFAGAAYEGDVYARISWTGALPDLIVSALSYNLAGAIIGDAVAATVTVKNNSTVNLTTPFRVDFYKNRTSAPTAGTVGDLFQTVTSLAAGASIVVNFYDLTTLVSGTWNSYVYLDENSLIPESNESNNSTGTVVVNWLPLPAIDDLTIQHIPQTDEIQLNWSYSMGVRRFKIYQDANPHGTFQDLLGTSLDPSFNTPVNENKYFYRVTAERQ